jgi:hypothetical protein
MMGFNAESADEGAANGARTGLATTVGEHIIKTVVADTVLVGTGDHRPASKYMIRFEANIANLCVGFLAFELKLGVCRLRRVVFGLLHVGNKSTNNYILLVSSTL